MAVYKDGVKTSDLNVQSDFTESNIESAAFIKNIPALDTAINASSTNNAAPSSKAVFTETEKKPNKNGNNTFTGENKFTGAIVLPTKATMTPGAIWVT